MDEIKTLLTGYYTYLGAFLAGVWWARVTPQTANLAIVAGVVALGIGVFRYPWVSAQPTLVRALWAAAACSVIGLAAYHVLWTSSVPLGIHVSTTTATYPAETTIGGIPWKVSYREIRIFISNSSKIDCRDIDLVLQPDHAVTAAGQITQIPNVNLSFNEPPSVTPEWLDPQTGQRTAMPMALLASTLGYRLRLDALPRQSRLEIILAAVTPNDVPSADDADKLINMKMSDGHSFWFAKPEHTDRVFGQQPSVSKVSIMGEYLASNKRNTISVTGPISDHFQDVIPKLNLPATPQITPAESKRSP